MGTNLDPCEMIVKDFGKDHSSYTKQHRAINTTESKPKKGIEEQTEGFSRPSLSVSDVRAGDPPSEKRGLSGSCRRGDRGYSCRVFLLGTRGLPSVRWPLRFRLTV